MNDIDDPADVGIALSTVLDRDKRKREGREPPMAMCPRCRTEPLVSTFDRAGAEFHCVVCGGWFGFLAPIPAETTDELNARLAEHEATYKQYRR
jgi:hypothetical protein